MKKIFATTLALSLVAGNIAMAQAITPLDSTPSTQGAGVATIQIGNVALPASAVVGAIIVVAGITYLVVEAADGS